MAALVGSTEGTATTGTADSITRTCTAGNSLVVCLRWYGAFTVSSITCSGETISLVGSAAVGPTGRSQFAVINNIASSGSKTVNVTYSGSTSTTTLNASEWSGTLTSGAAGAHPAASTGTSTNATHSITTTAASSALIGILMDNDGGASTPGAGYTTLGFGSSFSYEYGEYNANTGAAGAKTVNWTSANSDWHVDALEILDAGGAVVEQPPSQIAWDVSADTFEPADHGDASIFDYYTDNNVVGRANVEPPIQALVPNAYEWEDADRWNDAVWLWPMAQGPPPDDFFPDYVRPQDGSDQIHDVDEDFAWFAAPLAADVAIGPMAVWVVEDASGQFEEPDEPYGFDLAPLADDNVQSPMAAAFFDDAATQLEDFDEPFGFEDKPLPEDILDQLSNEFDGYWGQDEDELEGFSADPQNTDVAQPDFVQGYDADDQQEETEEFGFDFAAVQDSIADDSPFVEDASGQLEDEETDFGFYAAPQETAPDDQPSFEDGADQLELDEELEGFSIGPLADDSIVDLNFIAQEDADTQPDTPDDEDYGFFDEPLAEDFFPDFVWPHDSSDQPDTAEDEDYSFSAGPTPDDVVTAPVEQVGGGGWEANPAWVMRQRKLRSERIQAPINESANETTGKAKTALEQRRESRRLEAKSRRLTEELRLILDEQDQLKAGIATLEIQLIEAGIDDEDIAVILALAC
jgi:hypothetical protein